MKRKTAKIKAKRRIAPKRLTRKNRALDVTARVNVTTKFGDSPGRRYAVLKPWLDFANAAYPVMRAPSRWREGQTNLEELVVAVQPFLQQAQGTREFPARFLLHYLEPPAKEFEAYNDPAIIADIASGVIMILEHCVQMAAGESIPLVVPHSSSIQASVKDGRLELESFIDPFADFLRAVGGVEARRIGICPICRRFYFAIRSDSRTCSRGCGTALRVREWRVNQNKYEYNRKLKSAGVKPAKGKK
jgi:hypothetical protein